MKNLKKKLLKKPKDKKISPDDFLSTGSTLLNLACTDTTYGGLIKGKFHNLVGDSDTGKSVLAKTILAEVILNPEFDDYQLIYNNAERALLIPLPILDSNPRFHIVESNSPEEFYYDLDDRVSKGPIIYILDSMDSLVAEAAEKKFKKQKTAHRNQRVETGSYGVDKAKTNAANLNRVCSKLGKNGSILLIISQTHDNLNAMLFGPKKTRSGGNALKFYNRWEVWLSVRGKIESTYKDKKIQIGTLTEAKVQKNHITGKKRKVVIPVYTEHGIDDVGSCIDYLVEWKHWKGSKAKVQAPEFKFSGSKRELIKKIRAKKKREMKLKRIVGKVWKTVEEKVSVSWKSKYEV